MESIRQKITKEKSLKEKIDPGRGRRKVED